ncbi:hypothetical protein [Brochothrix thermosphacta]|uniref:hypothetical protein n=1 Tax=Brochothrix thermosphacta TaxID=2756 RepID=UPI000D79C3F4|nr:hypothetical protein [Brochothrix thermosphacta]SPN74314.1 hypothetical protein BTEBP_10106 [Brochothrix thermosphacta]
MLSFIIQIVIGMIMALSGVFYISIASSPNYLIIGLMYLIAVILIALAIAKVLKGKLV